MLHREPLLPLFRSTWQELIVRFDGEQLEAWAASVLELADVNAGPSGLLAFWQISRNHPAGEAIAPLLASAHAAADICRHAGAKASAAALSALPDARRILGSNASLPRWWRIMDDLARQAPESVEAAASRMEQILAAGDIEAFESFVASGLKVSAGNRKRRLAFFTLEDELARRLIERASVGVGFAEAERQTKAFVTSLWGRPALLRSLPMDSGLTQQRRAAIAGPLIRLPEFYRGIQGDAAHALYRAAAAHAQAHLVFGGPRFPVGKLKPLQTALVTLIEDARVETLAMRQLPGLRRLWSPYHAAAPSSVSTVPVLLARLARALFDPDYRDDDGFVGKGRAMFTAALPRIGDPAISREIGMLLGNDLGQMRKQFNAKTYVVEPLYRDDGLGLWDFGEDAPSSGEASEIAVEAARLDQQDGQGDQHHDPDSQQEEVGRGRPAGTGSAGKRDREISGMGPYLQHRTAGMDHRARGRRAAGQSARDRGGAEPSRCAAKPDHPAGPWRARRSVGPAQPADRRA